MEDGRWKIDLMDIWVPLFAFIACIYTYIHDSIVLIVLFRSDQIDQARWESIVYTHLSADDEYNSFIHSSTSRYRGVIICPHDFRKSNDVCEMVTYLNFMLLTACFFFV